jgi:hypothetical protein
MVSVRKKDIYENQDTEKSNRSSLLKLGLISASSAVIGGLAAAWWYRKTLIKLQNPIVRDDIRKLESDDDHI